MTDTGSKITTKNTVKDLGVILNSNLKYDDHIEKIISKVNGICSWILHIFQNRNREVLLTLLKSLVLPHLDYCSQLWSPTKRSLIQRLESLQRSFFRKLSSVNNLNYWEQLKKLKMYSLERRRERYRILYTWYILEGSVPNFDFEGTLGDIHHYGNLIIGRMCRPKTVKSHGSKNIWRGSLSEEGPRLFNSLPKKLRNLHGCSKDHFKKQLDHFLCTVPDEPLLQGYLPFRRADSNSLSVMVKHPNFQFG